MKSRKIISSMLVGLSLTNLSYGACEEERRFRDEAKSRYEDWCIATGYVGMGGGIAGGILASDYIPQIHIADWIGGLGGLAGLLPAIGAIRTKALYDRREHELADCESRQLQVEANRVEAERQAQLHEKATQIAQEVTTVTAKWKERFDRALKSQLDALREKYLGEGKDFEDPSVADEFLKESGVISERYFP